MDDQKKRRNDYQTLMNKAILFTICLLNAVSNGAFSQFPHAEITNGIISARIYVPDPVNGYYRGTRFDWSGINAEIKYGGHSFSGQWFEKYDPFLHDAVMGPVEAFSPVGFEESSPGGYFTIIGVGVLQKQDSIYSPYRFYKIIDPGKWKVYTKHNQVQFVHELRDSGYSYKYKKTERLTKAKPEMVLMHKLKNTGHRILETMVYDHNFFLIDGQPTGPPFEITFSFPLTEKKEGQGLGEMISIKGNRMVVNRSFLKNEQAYTVLEGYGQTAKDYDIRIENHKTGAGVHIRANRPISKLVFWACSTILCPEPYIFLKIKPGETATWKISYQFYNCQINP
jgi:ribosomal protein S17